MDIKAAVLDAMGAESPYAASKPLTIETLQLDGPGPGEVLVRIKAAGLCHSDLSVINGNRPRPMPMALGHEAAGIVEEVGPTEGVGGGGDLQPGDHVVFVFVPSCGHCEPCTEGRPALCEPGAAANGAGTLLSGARRLRRQDGTVLPHLAWKLEKCCGTPITTTSHGRRKRYGLYNLLAFSWVPHTTGHWLVGFPRLGAPSRQASSTSIVLRVPIAW
jgi:Alcohol dehydrogenase GroES-like domain